MTEILVYYRLVQATSVAISLILAAVLIFFRWRYSINRSIARENASEQEKLVSVVIAARNEQASIAKTLSDLLRQETVAEIIVVDDGSTDSTANIVREAAQESPRIRLVNAPPLPVDWIGKVHAINYGAELCTSDYILFCDADVSVKDRLIDDVSRMMTTNNLDHVGGYFKMEFHKATEAICGTVLSTIAFVALGLSALATGAGTGAFNMIRRSAYTQIGGHFEIRNHIVDDVAFARFARRSGLKTRFVDMSTLLSVRLFEGISGFLKAVNRSAIPFLGKSPIIALLMAVLSIILCLPLLVAPFEAAYSIGQMVITQNEVSSHMPLALPMIAYFSGALPFLLGRWLHNGSRLWSCFYIVALYAMLTSVLVSVAKQIVGCRVEWRGRYYQQLPGK